MVDSRPSTPPTAPLASKKMQWSIAAFKAMCLSLFFAVIAFIGSQEFQNISTIREHAHVMSKDRLPEFIENQKTLANIENLRRIAEVTNISENPKDRRHARISADALTAESVFDRDPGFRSAARKVAAAIKNLVASKNEVDAQVLALESLEAEIYASVKSLALTAATQEQAVHLMELATIDVLQDPVSRRINLAAEQKRTSTLIADLTGITLKGRPKNLNKQEEHAVSIKNLESLMKERLALVESVVLQHNQVQKIWRV